MVIRAEIWLFWRTIQAQALGRVVESEENSVSMKDEKMNPLPERGADAATQVGIQTLRAGA